MAVGLEVSYIDVNGVPATNRLSIDAAANAATVAQQLKQLTNCKIVAANILTPVDISGLTSNTASATNNESAKFKMAISLTGPIPAGATRRPGTIIQVPAPVGTLINGASGDPTLAAFTALLAHVTTNRGEVLDTVKSVNYIR